MAAPDAVGNEGAVAGERFARRRTSYWLQVKLLPYLLVAPLVLFIAALAVYPTIVTTVQAFYAQGTLDPFPRFVGIGNFLQLAEDAQTRESWANTGLYVVVGVILSTVLATGAALVMRRRFWGRGVVLALVILPWALPGVVEGVIWKWIYDPTFGVLNSVLASLHIISQYQIWIGTNRLLSIFFIELTQVWQITPLSALIILAAMQQIPKEVEEAAKVDGCTGFRVLRWITVPLIRTGLAVAIVQAVVLSLNIFDQVYVLNGDAPAGNSIMSQTYFITFQELDFGKGYALSLMATIATVAISLLVLRAFYRHVEY